MKALLNPNDANPVEYHRDGGYNMKVQLNQDNLVTFFARIIHCNKSHTLLQHELMDNVQFDCGECGEPIAFRSEGNNLWYLAGGRLFE